MNLSSYLADAARRLRESRSLDLFMELRYHELARMFPHDVFSVGQASLDFFDRALANLNGAPFDEPTKDGQPPPKPSEYEANYRRWIGAHQS